MRFFEQINSTDLTYPSGTNYKDDDIIRQDDLIYIDEPIFFDRCGYPMTLNDALAEVEYKYKSFVYTMLNSVSGEYVLENGGNCEFNGRKFNDPDFNTKEVCGAIMRTLAHRQLQMKKFGGRERRIYATENKDAISQTRIFRVEEISYCKTGVYVPSQSYSGYMDGYSDYEPAYLDKIKTHKILHLKNFNGSWIDCFGLRIEDIRVSKIHVDKRWFVCNSCCRNGIQTYLYKNMTRDQLENWEQPCSLDKKLGEECGYRMELAVMGQKRKKANETIN